MRLEDIISYLEKGLGNGNSLQEILDKKSAPEILKVLRFILERVEYRTLVALQLKISHQQVMKDVQLLLTTKGRELYRNSPTFQFFRATAYPGTTQYRLFVEALLPKKP